MTRLVLALAVVLAVPFAPSSRSEAQSVDRTTPASALSDLHAEAAAVGFADVDALRALPWFDEVVRDALLDQGATRPSAQRAILMLSHTHAGHASLVRGSGDYAIFAAVVIHGDYMRNEVPTAVRGILPGLLAGLWYETTIDGHRAFDMGVAALVEITPHDWILGRRVHGGLPIPGSTPSDDLRRLVEAGRALSGGANATQLAYGVLDGVDSSLPGSAPPADLEDIFHGPREALASFSTSGQNFVVNWDVTLHHEADAVRWETHYRTSISGLAARLHVPESSIQLTMTRTGSRLVARIEVDRVGADAFVADLVGRALPQAVSSGTSGPGAANP